MNKSLLLIFAALGMSPCAPAFSQATIKPPAVVSDREAVKADRAKADIDAQRNGTARPWDRDAAGRRPWDSKTSDGK